MARMPRAIIPSWPGRPLPESAQIDAKVAELRKEDGSVTDPVHQPVFGIDAARPVASQCVTEALRLARSLERVPEDLLDQPVDPLEHRAVLLLPVQIVVPGVGREDQLHSRKLFLKENIK